MNRIDPELLSLIKKAVRALDIAIERSEGDTFGIHHNEVMDTMDALTKRIALDDETAAKEEQAKAELRTAAKELRSVARELLESSLSRRFQRLPRRDQSPWG